MIEIAGYFASVFAGLSLGLIGGGGSILTVPILVYFFGIEPTLATTYSLFVVGITSAFGSLSYFRKKNVHIKMTLLFGLPSLAAVFIMRKYVMPAIPHHLLYLGEWEITKPVLLMLVFSILMIVAALSMIRQRTESIKPETENCNCPQLIVQGLLVGIITGFVGVGGGFLIIPSLVLFAKLPIKKAVGTSLSIMAISSLIGVTGDVLDKIQIDYGFLFLFSSFAVAGIIAGSFLTGYIRESKLKPAFGWFVLVAGMLILISECIK